MSEPRSPSGSRGGVRTPRRHDSALKHVTGEADLYRRHAASRAGLLHVYLGISAQAHARIISARPATRCARAPGVVAGADGRDIPGANDVSPPIATTSRCSPTALVEYRGQPLFAVAARTRDRGAARGPARGRRVSRT